MIIGGVNNTPLNDGGRYDPAADRWTGIATVGAPSPRFQTHRRVDRQPSAHLGRQTRLEHPHQHRRQLRSADEHLDRTEHEGCPVRPHRPHRRVGRHRDDDPGRPRPRPAQRRLPLPSTDTWSALSTENSPAGRSGHAALWTGDGMLLWGGYNSIFLNDTFRFSPQ